MYNCVKRGIAACILTATLVSSSLSIQVSASAEAGSNEMDEENVLIAASIFMNSKDKENDYWPEQIEVDTLDPLYNSDNEQVAWYLKLSTGAYAVVNNDINNPTVIEFGDEPSKEIETVYENNNVPHIVYNSPFEVYDTKLDGSSENMKSSKDLYENFPELRSNNTYLKKAFKKQKQFVDNQVTVMSTGGYGFYNWGDMPSGSYSSDWIPFGSTDWAITSDYSSFAENHCGATCVTNLALYYASRGYSNLKVSNSKDSTFKKVYDIVGPGPVMTIADEAKQYFKARGYTLKNRSVGTFSGLKTAIGNDRPLGILLCNGIVDWHWVLCVGYREYITGDDYMRIVDGWNNTANRFYKVNSGSLWISATEYWVG